MDLRGYLKALSELFLPRTCVVCGSRLAMHEKHICLYCLADMPYTFFWIRRNNPMADRFNQKIQSHIQSQAELCGNQFPAESPEHYAYAAALFFYKTGSLYREITRALKYHGMIAEGRYFASLLGGYLAKSEIYADVDAVVPVPLHFMRYLKRGYNQAEIIASAIAESYGCSALLMRSALRRSRSTKTQTHLTIEQKERNVSGAFVVNPKCIRQLSECKHILLVDDVFTTGSTLGECYWALRQILGPKVRISVATLAVVGA